MALSGLGALAYWAWAWRGPAPANVGLVVFLGALAAFAQHFPLPIGPRHKVDASSAVYFAALLLFGMPVALGLVGVSQLVDFIRVREPQLITYGFYIDDEAGTMTVVAVHPDSASLELHMDIGGAEFRKLANLLTLTAIECYGRPSERAMEQLRQKAAALGDGGTIVSIGRYAGFARVTSATA